MKTTFYSINRKIKVLGSFWVLLSLAVQCTSPKETVVQWEVFEKELTTDKNYTNAQKYCKVILNATFTGPENSSYTVPGFWDGENTWRIRFTPTLPGDWSYTINSSDNQIDAPENDGGFTTVEPSDRDISVNPNYRGFLKVSDNSRYLTYADGTPFFWMGGTLWDGNGKIAVFDPDYKTYVDNRKGKKYSVLQVLIKLGGDMQSQKPKHAYPPDWDSNEGGTIFNNEYDEINPLNFQWTDKRFKYIADAGMVPVIVFNEGYTINLMSTAELKNFFRYCVARYQAYNVLWIICAEYGYADDVNKVRGLANFVHGLDEMGHLTTIHVGPPWPYSSSKEFHGEEWIDFHMQQAMSYSGNNPADIYQYVQDDYQLTNPLPVIMDETEYEGDKIRDPIPTNDHIRQAAWKAHMAGGFYTYGAGQLSWRYHLAGLDNVDLPGSFDMQRLVEFFSPMEWWKLAPRDELVSSGHCLYSEESEWKQYVIYLVSGGSTTISDFSPTSLAQWYNPRDGSYQTASEGPEFTAPDEKDWVLYLKRSM